MKQRRRWFAILALFFLATSAPAQQRPLVWAADLDGGLPYVFYDADGNLTGFEVDLKDALARELGRPIVFQQYVFESLLDGVGRGDFDFAMNGLEITPVNQQKARFTRPYYLYQLQLVARQDEARFRSLQECKEQGLTVATLGGSVAERLLNAEGIDNYGPDNPELAYENLRRGRQTDAVLLDLPIALYYTVPDPSLKYGKHLTGLKFVGPPFAEGFYGIAVKQDNEALARDLDAALERLLDSGELKRILTKWELWNPDQYRLRSLERVGPEQAQSLPVERIAWDLLAGAAMTVALTVASMLLAVLLGLPLALARLYGPWPLRLFAIVYVEFFRGIPVLFLVYFLYFSLPNLFPGLNLPGIVAAVLGFGLNYAAYEAEIYRAGLQAIPVGQWEAAASLGMSPALTFRRVVLPQALRIILPPMTSDFIALFKDTSVVSIIGVIELSKQYLILTKNYGGHLEIALATALLYLVMSVPLGFLSRHLEKRWGGIVP